MSDTIVVQSFRKHKPTSWDARCIASVKLWATNCKYDYSFYGDEIFDYAPPQLCNKYKNNKVTLTDYVRLKALVKHSSEHRVVIWIDADVIVFNENLITIPTSTGLHLCKVNSTINSTIDCNNTVVASIQDHSGLNDLATISLDTIERSHVNNKFAINGLKFFNQTNVPFSNSNFGVGLLNLDMINEIVTEDHKHIVRYGRHLSAPIGGTNLCGSLRSLGNTAIDRYNIVIDHLLHSRGDVINQYYYSKINRLQRR